MQNNEKETNIKILMDQEVPTLGRTIVFIDEKGLAIRVGDEKSYFIARDASDGQNMSIEYSSPEALEIAKRVSGEILNRRGGNFQTNKI